jgi:glycosyltransferase involved in cell wall biosynthesis
MAARARLRILFVARRYWPAVGGVETFMRYLARELGSRHSVTVLAHRIDDGPATRLTDSLQPPPPFQPFEDGPVHVEPFSLTPRRRILLAPLLSQVTPGLRRYSYGRMRVAAAALYARVAAPVIADQLRGADAVHMWGSDLLAAATLRAADLTAVPLVITPFAHRAEWGDDPASAAVYRRADRVVSLLKWDASLYRELGVPDAHLAVGGVCSPPIAAGGGGAVRERFRIRGPLVLYLGVRRSYKGYDIMLDAAQQVARHRPDVTFAFLGPGPRLRPLPSAVPVIDLGRLDDAGRAAWIDAADLLCLPSRSEIFPVSFLEAWSLRKPVLTSDLPPLRELIDRSGGGITVEPNSQAVAEGIDGLLRDGVRLRALGEAGYRFWAASHTVTAVARWHERLYASLTKGEVTACAI